MMRSIVAQEHGNGCRGDDDVANPAESIGNLTEDEIAENCRKDNLAIVIDGNFSGALRDALQSSRYPQDNDCWEQQNA